MARMVAIYKTPKDKAAFERHYFGTHVPLAKQLPGLRKYEVSSGPIMAPAGGDCHFAAILHFDDMAAVRTAFASPVGQQCAADRRNLAADGDVQILIFEDREA
jgi:uncharacterized protein (TIGR02118 family)